MTRTRATEWLALIALPVVVACVCIPLFVQPSQQPVKDIPTTITELPGLIQVEQSDRVVYMTVGSVTMLADHPQGMLTDQPVIAMKCAGMDYRLYYSDPQVPERLISIFRDNAKKKSEKP